MILPVIRIVVPDGSGVLAVGSVAWRWTAGDDVIIPARVVKQDGSAYALTAGETVGTLAFWESETDGLPAFQVDFVLDDAVGMDPVTTATFTIGRDDLPAGIYAVGARFVDSETEQRDTVLLPGRVEVDL